MPVGCHLRTTQLAQTFESYAQLSFLVWGGRHLQVPSGNFAEVIQIVGASFACE